MPTINVYANQTFCTRYATPDTNIIPGASVTLSYWSDSLGWDNIRAFFTFPIPNELRYKRIINTNFNAFVYKSVSGGNIAWGELDGNPPVSNEITANNAPNTILTQNLCDIRSHSGWHWEIRKSPFPEAALQNGIDVVGGKDSQIQTSYSSNKPYLEITYEPIYFHYVEGYPSTGFINDKKPITLTWTPYGSYFIEPMFGQLCIIEAEIAYRESDGPWVSQIVRYSEAEQRQTASITIPANTIKKMIFQHKLVRIVSNDNVTTTGFTEVLTLSTVDTTSTAAPVRPLNDRVDISAPIAFEWRHIIATGTEQTKAELQYSTDNATWITFFTAQGAAQSGVVAAHTLPAGKIWWRVRTFNSDNIAGAFSASSTIIGYGAPPAPAGLIANNAARPVIQWQSQTQIAYELKIEQAGKTILYVEEFASTEKRYAVQTYLNDGTYTAAVRIKNKSLEYSNWSTTTFQIATAKPIAPIVTIKPTAYGVSVSVVGSYAKTYLLRDNVPIAKFSGTYTDYSAAGEHAYIVRGVDALDRFADSAPQIARANIDCVVIAPTAMPSQFILLSFQISASDGFQSTITLDATTRHYAGRNAPIMHTSGFISQSIPIRFGSKSGAEWEKLKELLESGETVLYRDQHGNRAYGFLQSGNISSVMGITGVEMELIRTDYIEEIDYD